MATTETFLTVRTEGALLPSDFLQRLTTPRSGIEGLAPDAYHLAPGEKVTVAVSRAWGRLRPAWKAFQAATAALAPDDPATTPTRERWLLPLFEALGYGRLATTKAVEVEGRSYPVSHAWGHLPIHLVGRGIDLDRRTQGVVGAATASPHGLLQQLLNHSDAHLWGLVSNGHKLRLLRDNRSLTRQAFVEFDLAAMMDGEAYSDFVLLFLLLHVSRLEGDRPEECWLERWSRTAQQEGVRALENLRKGVEEAITALGQGFLSHPANKEVRKSLSSGSLDRQEYYRQLLRLVYRLIFLFVAEDRGLLHPKAAPEAAQNRYGAFYSTRRLRDLSRQRRGSAHGDLWEALLLVMRQLGSDQGCPELGLPALGSFLWRDEAVPDLGQCRLANSDLLSAVRSLAFAADRHVLRPVDYRNLGPEELGSVYEALLELHPQLEPDGGAFALGTAPGHERKETGSYYTKASLIRCVLDSALEPILRHASQAPYPEKALLGLAVCDPACGSGHFLIAAAHRIARRLASVRTADEEPSPQAVTSALRDVISRCVYGVDINPMAAELCKISLWLDALNPGMPLAFLDHHIQVGNALIGATPALLASGPPDSAFDPLEGDDPEIAASIRKQNKVERERQATLFSAFAAAAADADLDAATTQIEVGADSTVAAVRQKEDAWRRLLASAEYGRAVQLADAWCAAFVWPKDSSSSRLQAPTSALLASIRSEPGQVHPATRQAVSRLARGYGFFHWHLAFPHVFGSLSGADTAEATPGWSGGFDMVLGNPPWDTLSPDVKEFFAEYAPEIRSQDRAGQSATVTRLLETPSIRDAWVSHRRHLYGTVHFLKNSGRYQLFAPGNLGKGDFNVYRMFVETAFQIARPGGQVAQLVPEGLYNGANCMAIRRHLFDRCSLRSVLGFENNREVWFKGIDSRTKFAIYSAGTSGKTETFQAAFNIRTEQRLARVLAGETLTIPVSVVEEFSPDALAIMEFDRQLDIAIATRMYSRHPKFGDASAPAPFREYMREIDMGNDRDLFTEEARGVPVFEGRMVAQYDYRAKGYRSGRGRAAVWADLAFDEDGKSVQPQWRIPRKRIPPKVLGRLETYRVGFCDVTSPTNERSLVATIVPPGAVCGHSLPTILYPSSFTWAYAAFLAVANSFVLDFLARKKVSLHVTFTILDSMPIPRFDATDPVVRLLVPRALQLACAGPEMLPLWEEMTSQGWVDQAARPATNPADRQRLQNEVDAIVALGLYGLARSELELVLDAFPIVREEDEMRYGDYRTKLQILAVYDAIQESIDYGTPYQSILDPPPAHPSVAHVAPAPDSAK